MILLYFFITLFTIYFILLSAVSMKPSRKIRDKYTSKDLNLCVVLYASGNTNKLENLIKQLKEQSYPKQNYTIYTILDKCENISEVTLQSDLNVNVININNLEPIGKSQAYSIIAEKLQDVVDLNAYVFIDANTYVESDFLENVNFYLTKYQVFNPIINYIPSSDKFTLLQNIKHSYAKYINKFINISRTRLGFTNILNTDVFVIRKDVLNKIASFNFRDIVAELEYTYTLVKEGVKVAVINDLNVYKSIDYFDFRIPSLSKRLNIFWSNIFKNNDIISLEFLLSLVAPNWLTYLLCYIIVLKHAYLFPFIVDYSTILITGIILLLALCSSILNSNLSTNDCKYLILYPFYSIARLIYNFPFFRSIRNIFKQTTRRRIIESETVDVFVTDGKKDFPCKLTLISEDGLAKVAFINKGKKYTTKNNHIRMVDAVRELVAKLSEYGLNLKVCQCCKYYQPLVDGSTNMVKGCCKCEFQGRTPGDIIPTLIWNTCPNFEEQNIVNLF